MAVLARDSHVSQRCVLRWHVSDAVRAPINLMLKAEEVAFVLRHAGRCDARVPASAASGAHVDFPWPDRDCGAGNRPRARGPASFTDPERTAAAFEGGWSHSGDSAVVDAEGYVTIVDRKKDGPSRGVSGSTTRRPASSARQRQSSALAITPVSIHCRILSSS